MPAHTAALAKPVVSTTSVGTVATVVSDNPNPTGPSLTPRFRIEFRRRHDETAPVEVAFLNARTMASARHAARLAHPDTVILSVSRT